MHFQVRVDKNEQVGLATCTAGHDSLLLDSRDYWAEVIQDGRPPIAKCRCKSKRFLLSLHYQFRAEGDVASVEEVYGAQPIPSAPCGSLETGRRGSGSQVGRLRSFLLK